jgi:hypothetical protein
MSMTLNRKNHQFPQLVSEGALNGHESLNIFGFNPAIDGTAIAAWENNVPYAFPPGPLAMTAQSTSAGDTGIVLRVFYLDADYVRNTVDVTLAGLAAVVIVPDILRINNVITLSGNAIGTVTIENAGNIYAQINPGIGKTQMSIYTVPANFSFYLYRIDAWSGTTTGASKYLTFFNQIAFENGTTWTLAETTFIQNMNVVRVFPLKYDEKTDIQFQAMSSSGLNEIGIFVEGVLIDDRVPPYI